MMYGMVLQAAFGKSALAVTSFFTYIGLALGFLGSSLSLPFGLFVLIVQRDGEKYIQDQVRPGAPQFFWILSKLSCASSICTVVWHASTPIVVRRH